MTVANGTMEGTMTDESHPQAGNSPAPEEEMVDGLPVLAEVRALSSSPPVLVPGLQAAAAAATGFFAGAATIALVRRRSSRKFARANRGTGRRAADLRPIVASRTFIVDVHLVAGRD
ncbi:MAG TPA: hypothetical protein VIX82_07240 [Solirubrobacteraceae bacterium]